MKMQQIRGIARSMGVRLTFGGTKQQLVQSIQSAEGNIPCFGTAVDEQCDQLDCLWREDCLGGHKKRRSGAA